MNLDLGSNLKTNRSFELVLQVRDSNGLPTGKTKSYDTDDAVKLHTFWVRNSPKMKKKKKNKAAKSTKEINTALAEAESHTKMIRRKRKLED